MGRSRPHRRRNARKSAARESKPSQLGGVVQLAQIPDHIICSNIIPRLPGKSLIRFKCVSKLWNSTILDLNSTSFGNIRGPKTASMSFEYTKRSINLCFHMMDSKGSTEKFSLEKPITEYYHRDGHIAGSCNGLLLIILGASFFVWNPCTEYFSCVLKSDKIKPPYFVTNSGICYDSSTDDYKVVIGLENSSIRAREFSRGPVLVAGLRNKDWKKLKFPYRCHRGTSGVLFNGFLHWRANTNKGYCTNPAPNKIIVFYPETDQVRELPMLQGRSGHILGLGVLDDCLCMSCWDINQVEVITMKEYGNEESWTPLFEISILKFYSIPCSTKLTPLMLMENGQVLMLRGDNYPDDTIFGYNPQTMEFNYEYPKVLGRFPHIFIESLNNPCGRILAKLKRFHMIRI